MPVTPASVAASRNCWETNGQSNDGKEELTQIFLEPIWPRLAKNCTVPDVRSLPIWHLFRHVGRPDRHRLVASRQKTRSFNHPSVCRFIRSCSQLAPAICPRRPQQVLWLRLFSFASASEECLKALVRILLLIARPHEIGVAVPAYSWEIPFRAPLVRWAGCYATLPRLTLHAQGSVLRSDGFARILEAF